MNLLISIHKEHVDKILAGEKRWEYRKSIFRKPKNEINKVYIYCTSPVEKIIANFEIGRIIEDKSLEIWNKTDDESGTTKQKLLKYFEEYEKGYAIEIKNLNQFKDPIDPYEKLKDFQAPQSYLYMNSF